MKEFFDTIHRFYLHIVVQDGYKGKIGRETECAKKQQRGLHDGRANSLIEAILWHGGEAEKSKQEILKLSIEEVENLIKFIESL